MELVPLIVPGAASVELDGCAVLFDGTNIRLLNPSASMIWHQIDGRRSPEDIVRRLTEMAPVSPARVTVDVRDFLTALSNARLIDWVPEVSPRLRVAPHTASTSDDDGSVILLNLETGRRTTLFGTATDAWRAVCRENTLQGVIDDLLTRHADATVESDIRSLVHDLARSGYLELL
jgi:hypothetical protein